MKIFYATFLLFFINPNISISQEDAISVDYSQKISPQEEIAMLEEKKNNLIYRINILKENPIENSTQINNLEFLLQSINRKIEGYQKIIISENYAAQSGMPKKGNLTDEEYKNKKLEWMNSDNSNGTEMIIKTTITRYEFNKLSEEVQKKVLSMPERYIIID